jgi:outer membrane autotransporter protein
VHSAVAFAIILAVAATPAWSQVDSGPIVVNTTDDITGAPGQGTQSFRWAVNEANRRGSGPDTIEFDLGDKAALDLLADDKKQITISLDLSPNEIFQINSELTITAPSQDDTEYFLFIRRTGTEPNDIFLTQQNLTLINVDLISEGLIFNGPIPGNRADTIDVVYDISGVGEYVLRQRQQEFFFQRPRVGNGRVIKTGLGKIAYLSPDAEFGGGFVLADGILETDADSLPGDIQICSNEGDIASTNCDDASVRFRIEPEDSGSFDGNIRDYLVNDENSDPVILMNEEGDPVNGQVLKLGTGSLELTGDNDYAGGTYVIEGALSGDTDAIQGEVYICPGVVLDPNENASLNCLDEVTQATLQIDIDTESTFAGTLKGGGIFEKDGNGRLIVDGTQENFGGDLNILNGELALENDLGSVAMSNIVDVTVSGGATLSGSTESVISGGVTVESGGTLRLDPGATMTANTATLANRSTIEVTVSATPTTGKIKLMDTVTPVSLGAGAVKVDFDMDWVTDVLNGTLDPVASYTIIDSDVAVGVDEILTGGPAGDGIAFKWAIFDLALSYDDSLACTDAGLGNVCLTATLAPSVEDDAETGNQQEIARAFDQAYICAQNPTLPECQIDQDTADDFNEVFVNFAVPADEIPDFLDQIAGEEYTALVDVRSAASTRYNRSISRRFDLEFPFTKEREKQASAVPAVSAQGNPIATLLRSVSTPSGFSGVAFAASEPNRGGYREYRQSRLAGRRGKREEPMSMGRHVSKGGITSWLDIHGVMGELGGSKNAEDVDYRIYGPLYGMDYAITDHVTAGVTLGYSRTEMKTPHSVSKTTGNTYQGGVYVGVVYDSFHVTGSTRFAHSDLKSRRSVRFNAIDRTASSDTDANDVSAFFEAAYHVPMQQNVLVQPMVSVSYDHLDQDSFSERGLNSLDLDIDGDKVDTLQTNFGVRVALFGRDDDDRYMLPQLRLAYEREWLDPSRALTGNLNSAGSNGEFKVNGLTLPQDRAVIGVSSEVGLSNNLNLFADYDLRAAKDLLEHSLSFGLRAIW